IEEPLAEYLDVSRSRLLTIVPVMPPSSGAREAAEGAADERLRAAKPKRPLGALIVEQVTDSRLRPDHDTRLEVLKEHLAQAFVNAQEHQQIPLLSVWKFIGRQTAALKGRRLAQTLLALAAVAIIAVALVIVPWDYRVEGKGRVMPVVRQNVFAPWD